MTDRAIQFATAKTYVFADSVLCVEGISTEPVKAWESRISRFLEKRYLRDLDRIDGEPTEFGWTVFPGFQGTDNIGHAELRSMLDNSREDIRRFKGLDPRRNSTEPMSTNLRKLLKA